jgi:DUF1680 family protein
MKSQVMTRGLFFLLGIKVIFLTAQGQDVHDYPINPVSFTKVKIEDKFWFSRLETNRKVTIPYAFEKCEETGRIQNFEVAGGIIEGKFVGIRFNDSDVFKIMEGAAYSLAIHPDPSLDRFLDDLIAKIAAAQEDDGYLYTARSIDPLNLPSNTGKERWAFLDQSHELYNVGHMYEAAVAHYQSTGKRSFLDIAIKNADLIESTFGHDKQYGVPGHQEIEIGLVKLYRVTGDDKYLNLAKYFLDVRGKEVPDAKYPQRLDPYFQSHIPVTDQKEAVGHAVRAIYMYCGMADVASMTEDMEYLRAIDELWANVVDKKLYVTGGVGARHSGEAFGADYELPNETAYNETCAAIANCMWNHRMFLLKGEAKYFDVLERTLYNGLLSGISMKGNEFFYPNPLACDANYAFNQGAMTRKPWFDCSCCPANIVRFLPSLPGYIYAVKGNDIFVNLYMSNTATISVADQPVQLIQETEYPWNGLIKIKVATETPKDFNLKLRIPGWSMNQPVPGDLYRYYDENNKRYALSINGQRTEAPVDKGYLSINRNWKNGDEITLDLPMDIRLVLSNDQVKDNKNLVAMERGPIVYCAEGIDNKGEVFNLLLPEYAPTNIQWKPDLLGGINIIKGDVPAFVVRENGEEVKTKSHNLVAVPYYAWSHRGIGEMSVWLPLRARKLRIEAK